MAVQKHKEMPTFPAEHKLSQTEIWTQLAPDLPEVVREPDFCSLRCSGMGIFCLASLKKKSILGRQPEERFNIAKSPLAGVASCFQGPGYEAEAFEIVGS